MCLQGSKTNVGARDDSLSDLQQSVRVALHFWWTFSFSLIAVVCGVRSTFSILEGIDIMNYETSVYETQDHGGWSTSCSPVLVYVLV